MRILRVLLFILSMVVAVNIAWALGLNPDYVFGHIVHLIMLGLVIRGAIWFWQQRKPPENPLRPGYGRALRDADVIELISRRKEKI
jgi:lipopolysaccharide export system protein LptC